MEFILSGLGLMIITQIWKWLISKLGVETGKYLVHGVLFVTCLVYALLNYWGLWREASVVLFSIWTTASGAYEVSKTIIGKIMSEE